MSIHVLKALEDTDILSVRPVNGVLDGYGVMPCKGGRHHGQEQRAEHIQGGAVAAVDPGVARQRLERARLLPQARVGAGQFLWLAAEAGAACSPAGDLHTPAYPGKRWARPK